MDIVKNVKLSALYEIYGGSLTEKQKQVVDFCVLQDLSLGEASDLLNISRQAVKYTLDNATESMLKLDEKLKFLSKIESLKEKLADVLKNTDEKEIKKKINKILEDI